MFLLTFRHRPRHLSQPHHRLGPRQGDRQRKQQDEPMDQGSDTHQERTRQVDKPRRKVLPTSTHLWLLTVNHSDSVVPAKAAAVAKTSRKTINIKVVFWWICQHIILLDSAYHNALLLGHWPVHQKLNCVSSVHLSSAQLSSVQLHSSVCTFSYQVFSFVFNQFRSLAK